MDNRQIIAALPAYNEAENLPQLLTALKPFCSQIVVVDDGSTDATQAIARDGGAHLVIHPTNQGLGPTIRDALQTAATLCDDDGLVVTMDADMTHPASLIPQMIQRIDSGADVVIASRYRAGAAVRGLALHRRWLSLGASWLFRLVYPTRGVRDYTCGYRVYRAKVLRDATARYGPALVEAEGFSCMAEILLKLRAMGCCFDEVGFVLRYDLKGGASKMQLWRTVKRTLGLLVKMKSQRD